MKKYMAICGAVAALAWVGVAAAATPQGKLTGTAGVALVIGTPITDGGTSFVGLENDKSKSCNGDAGSVSILGTSFQNVLCAHYVASSRDGSGPKMRFASTNLFIPDCYDVWRITDGTPVGLSDTVFGAPGLVCGFDQARAWVNKGAIGGAGGTWDDLGYPNPDFTITASQT